MQKLWLKAFRVKGLGFTVSGLGFRVQGSGLGFWRVGVERFWACQTSEGL